MTFLDLVTKRRTVRQFKSEPVPDECIPKVIEVARWAPSGFHTQPWGFVIIRDPEVKAKIVAVLDDRVPPLQDPAKFGFRRGSYRDTAVFILALCDWRAKSGLPFSARTDEEVEE